MSRLYPESHPRRLNPHTLSESAREHIAAICSAANIKPASIFYKEIEHAIAIYKKDRLEVAISMKGAEIRKELVAAKKHNDRLARALFKIAKTQLPTLRRSEPQQVIREMILPTLAGVEELLEQLGEEAEELEAGTRTLDYPTLILGATIKHLVVKRLRLTATSYEGGIFANILAAVMTEVEGVIHEPEGVKALALKALTIVVEELEPSTGQTGNLRFHINTAKL